MAQLDTSEDSTASAKHPLERLLFYMGSAALLTIMLIETISVLGRHTSLPLIGAIEIIQASIVIVACTSTVLTTLQSAHAKVHLLLGKLSPTIRAVVTRISAALASIFFIGLATGSFWLAYESWNAFEETEVLHISYRPLRVAVVIAAVVVAAIFFYNAIRRSAKR